MISLIIPFYDKHVSLISKKIENIKNIDFTGEVIFVDDRKDKTEKLDFQGYKCVSYEGNKNLFYARREGVLAASGDYIEFSDMDDEILKVDYNHENCDMVIYKTRVFNESKNIDYVVGYNCTTVFRNLSDSLKSNLSINFRFGVWSFLYKKSTLLKLYNSYPAFEGFFRYEDFFLNLAMLDFIRDIKFDGQVIYEYDIHPCEFNKEAFDFCMKNFHDGIGKKEFEILVGSLDRNSKKVNNEVI